MCLSRVSFEREGSRNDVHWKGAGLRLLVSCVHFKNHSESRGNFTAPPLVPALRYSLLLPCHSAESPLDENHNKIIASLTHNLAPSRYIWRQEPNLILFLLGPSSSRIFQVHLHINIQVDSVHQLSRVPFRLDSKSFQKFLDQTGGKQSRV